VDSILDAPVGKIGSEQFRSISRKDPAFFLIEDIQGFVALICLNKGLPGSIGPCCREIGYCGRFQPIQAVTAAADAPVLSGGRICAVITVRIRVFHPSLLVTSEIGNGAITIPTFVPSNLID
jgi:hypothetical protein